MAEMWESNPELIKSEIAKFYKRHEVPPLVDPEIRKKLRADLLKITGPTKVAYTPATDISVPTCVTRDEDNSFKMLANGPAHEAVFEIINPKTRLPDEALKAFVIKRYRESPDESSETMVTVAASGDSQIHSCRAFLILLITKANQDILICFPDEVPGACMLKRHCEDLGESSENVIADSSVPTPGNILITKLNQGVTDVPGASVLKCQCEDLGDSCETVATTSGIAHEVLGASMLKPHHEELGESSETMVADLLAPTTDNNQNHSYSSCV
ncbi:hypothetical protein CTI12_AA092840 [Artemisia annua]|uniref:Uncharacterized protein n=1 Tax=Artemisia annua TaxID=35608 RepID=A0A2U1PZU7_ARTAN|nr:hypothetical protein CTI12_AA092840 [Artemisia annua]